VSGNYWEIICSFQDKDWVGHLGVQLRICGVSLGKTEQAVGGNGKDFYAVFKSRD